MCIEDVRLGREAAREEKYVPLTAVPAVAVKQDASRYSLIIQNCGPNNVTLGFTSTVVDAVGIVLLPNGLPLVLNLQDNGQIVIGDIYGVCPAAGTATLAVWSAYLEKR